MTELANALTPPPAKSQQQRAPISAEERAKRKAAADFAFGSVRLEGFILGDEEKALFERYYVEGELTLQEFIDAGLALAEDFKRQDEEEAAAMQKLIAERVWAIRQGHASNLIEGLDIGETEFEAMLERAREPISNEEFTRRGLAILHEKVRRINPEYNPDT